MGLPAEEQTHVCMLEMEPPSALRVVVGVFHDQFRAQIRSVVLEKPIV